MHRESHDAERMEQLILAAVAEIFREQNFNRFLPWARERIPRLMGLDDDEMAPEDYRRLGALFGRAIWNATPLPKHGYRPHPIPPPALDQPCLCGSGRAFGDCCAQAGELPEMPSELIWEILLADLSEARLNEALRHRAIPEHLLARVADRWLDADHPRRAVRLLEPLFVAPLARRDARFELALETLCDAYDALGHGNKKRAFLRRVAREGDRALRTAAWQRLTALLIDDGAFAAARSAFEQALRHAPDSPANALLELTLLAAQRRDLLAGERARFWRGKFRRRSEQDPRLLGFLERAIHDPQGALAQLHGDALDPLLMALRDWIEYQSQRPLPVYNIEPLLVSSASAGRLCPPVALHWLERAWRRVFPRHQPRGACWTHDGWLRFLVNHPAAADSLEVLDDLATAVREHPESNLTWVAHTVLRPLCERAAAIVDASLHPLATVPTLPWAVPDNRPALRLLLRLALHRGGGERDRYAAGRPLELLLQLNPTDEQGARAPLMNHYLRYRDDPRALVLARDFPRDTSPELSYGQVLAFYRLGERAQAAQALGVAFARYPDIARLLTRKRARRPTPDADPHAWPYREAMRDVWENDPGLLTWLRKMTASAPRTAPSARTGLDRGGERAP